MLRIALFGTLVLVTAGSCGHRPSATSPDAADSTIGQDAASDLTADVGSDQDLAVSTQDPDTCVVATRIEGCCGRPATASVAEVRADPCLLGPDETPAGLTPGQCGRPNSCDSVDCEVVPLPSRLTARVKGRCAFVAECEDVDDCVLATNWAAGCCACPTAYPPLLLEDERCLVALGEDRPIGCIECTDVLCEKCLEVEIRCDPATTESLKRCVVVQLEP